MIQIAIAELKSFCEGESGVGSAVACGMRIVPALRAMLFEREPSGLYQSRCRAVEALAGLGAVEVLIEFLEAKRVIDDPIERIGEDAIINAAALALANFKEQRVFLLLLRLAQRPALTGVIGALGAFRRVEAIPALVDALEEDASRVTAENGLRKMGPSASAALIEAAARQEPEVRESESSLRRRRSALRLLDNIGFPRDSWSALCPLMRDADAKIAILACKICIEKASPAGKRDAASCLIALLKEEDWLLREEIEGILVRHFGEVGDVVQRYLAETFSSTGAGSREPVTSTLRHIVRRARAALPPTG